LALNTWGTSAGAFHFDALDWDVPISFIMALLAYRTAPWSMRVIFERHWRYWPGMLLATWFTVDRSYWLYWRVVDPFALEFMRGANWPESPSLQWSARPTPHTREQSGTDALLRPAV